MDTAQSILEILDPSIADSVATLHAYQQRVTEGLLTRDENPQDHFCAYFLPYNAQTKQVFIIHHKKSGLWLSPGGHVDQGETLLQTVNREINEELGMKDFFIELPKPFLLTITPIQRDTRPCKKHYDVWFLVPTDGSSFHVDPTEFHAAKWVTFDEAKVFITEPANVKALERVQTLG